MLAGEEQVNLTGVATHTAFYSAALDGEDFRETWDMLTAAAKMPGLLFHHLRRCRAQYGAARSYRTSGHAHLGL
jgi:hypothetical protein